MALYDNIKYVGVNDHAIDLFEGQYTVKDGMSYNSYLITDEKCAVTDTVDAYFIGEWLENIDRELGGKAPDYLIVHHMEPDHSAGIKAFAEKYPSAVIVGNKKIFAMADAFFGADAIKNRLEMNEGDTLSLGEHTLTFVFAPMVHWPEVMMSYESTEKILFSADGFGKFGALGTDEKWDDEARRYYFGIVGKYGAQVQAVLKKAAALEIEAICPLHGPVLTENLGHYIALYDKWSSYQPETDGVFIAYSSVYGHTAKAAKMLADELKKLGCESVEIADLARSDMAENIANAFKYSKLVLATVTYNSDVFPHMRTFIDGLTERSFKNRTVAFIENGSWAPVAVKVMQKKLAECKNISFAQAAVTVRSAVNDASAEQIKNLAKELCGE